MVNNVPCGSMVLVGANNLAAPNTDEIKACVFHCL